MLKYSQNDSLILHLGIFNLILNFKRENKYTKMKKLKQEFKRNLINEQIPYELIALSTLRYYAALQAAGQLDIVEHVMRIERITEQEAIDKCLAIFKAVSDEKSKHSERYLDLLKTEDMSGLFDRIKEN